MKILDKIINKIKSFFLKNKYKLLEEKKEITEVQSEENTNNDYIDIIEDSKKLFHGFKISTEVLELALKYEKKKKEIESKEQELIIINAEIQSLSKKLEKNTN